MTDFLIKYDGQYIDNGQIPEICMETMTSELTPTKSNRYSSTLATAVHRLGQKEDLLTFVQRNIISNNWAEMCIQQFTVVQFIREAIGSLTPEYFIFNSNTLFKSDSLQRTIREQRSNQDVGSFKPDMTVELNYNAFPQLKRENPFYFLTVEVEKKELDNIHDHNDYKKLLLELRSALNDAALSYATADITIHGVLACSNGMTLVSITAEAAHAAGEKAIFFKLQETPMFLFKDYTHVASFTKILKYHAYESMSKLFMLIPQQEEFMDSARAARLVTSSTFNKGISGYQFIDNDVQASTQLVVACCKKLPKVDTKKVLDNIYRLGVVKSLNTKQHDIERTKLETTMLGALLTRCSLAFVQENGLLYIVVNPDHGEKVDIIWKDGDDTFHMREGELRNGVIYRFGNNQNGSSNDSSNDSDDNEGDGDDDDSTYGKNNDSDEENNQEKRVMSQKNKGKGSNERTGKSMSSSCGARNFTLYNYLSINEIVKMINYKIERQLVCNDRCFAFLSHTLGGEDVFVKLSIGTKVEEKVMKDVPKHSNLVYIVKHECISIAPIGWKAILENHESKKICYITVTEPLEPYNNYLNYGKIQKLSGSSKLRILTHLMMGVIKGVQELHKNKIVHGDLSLANIMFRKTGNEVEQGFELKDAVITDMNCCYSMKHCMTGSIGSTRPFICDEDLFVTYEMDCFSIGVLLAHYLKLMITGNIWFSIPVTNAVENKKCHNLILKFIGDTQQDFVSVFGIENVACFSHIKKLIEGCMVIPSHERLTTRDIMIHMRHICRIIRNNNKSQSKHERRPLEDITQHSTPLNNKLSPMYPAFGVRRSLQSDRITH